jgi:ankyrin repeat protein
VLRLRLRDALRVSGFVVAVQAPPPEHVRRSNACSAAAAQTACLLRCCGPDGAALVALLLQHGAVPDTVDIDGWSPQQAAEFAVSDSVLSVITCAQLLHDLAVVLGF